jgi:hypothetical protein
VIIGHVWVIRKIGRPKTVGISILALLLERKDPTLRCENARLLMAKPGWARLYLEQEEYDA